MNGINPTKNGGPLPQIKKLCKEICTIAESYPLGNRELKKPVASASAIIALASDIQKEATKLLQITARYL